MKKFTLSASLLLFVCTLMAQYGRLDQTFNRAGFTKFSTGKEDSSFTTKGKKAFVQTDGKIITLYESGGMTLPARKNSNGAVDVTYRNGGFSTPVPITGAMALQLSDGKILVAGTFNPSYDEYLTIIYRFNTDGTLDKSLNGSGAISTGGGMLSDFKLQPDGRVLILSNKFDDRGDYIYFYIRRFNNSANNIDLDISKGYSLNQDTFIASIGGQSDGKIILAGNYLWRLNTDGSDDTNFGTNGRQTLATYTYSMVIQNDNKIIVGYESNFAVSRFLSTGTPDNSFGTNGTQSINTAGITYINSNSLTLQSDGKILFGGYAKTSTSIANFAMARYLSTGFPDNSFSGDGVLTTNFPSNASAEGVTSVSEGKLILTGYVQVGVVPGTNPQALTDAAIARYDASGNPDNTFDGDGKVVDHLIRMNTAFAAVAVQADGKAVCTGYSWNGKNFDFTTVRYKTDATLDSTFSGDGIQVQNFGWNDKATSLAIQTDGKIIVAGGANGNFALVRYKVNGTVDSTFGTNGKVVTDFGKTETIYAIKIQPDGKILVCGDYLLARYTSAGALDRSFNGNGRVVTTDIQKSLTLQADGKIILGCNSLYSSIYVRRFNTNGSADLNFGRDGYLYFVEGGEELYSEVTGVSVSSNGTIYVAASVEAPQFRSASNFYSFLGVANASQDILYSGNIALTHASALAVQNDGKILIAGYNFGLSIPTFSILRFNANYTPDNSFGTSGIQNTTSITTGASYANSLAISGNALYVAGWAQYPSIYGILARYTLGNVTAGRAALPITNNDLKLKLSPNPVKDLLYVELKTANKVDKTVIEISGLDGKKWDQKIIPISGKTNLPIDISKLPNGVYMMTVYCNGSKSTSTFIKQ